MSFSCTDFTWRLQSPVFVKLRPQSSYGQVVLKKREVSECSSVVLDTLRLRTSGERFGNAGFGAVAGYGLSHGSPHRSESWVGIIAHAPIGSCYNLLLRNIVPDSAGFQMRLDEGCAEVLEKTSALYHFLYRGSTFDELVGNSGNPQLHVVARCRPPAVVGSHGQVN